MRWAFLRTWQLYNIPEEISCRLFQRNIVAIVWRDRKKTTDSSVRISKILTGNISNKSRALPAYPVVYTKLRNFFFKFPIYLQSVGMHLANGGKG
jgi:hypothetical protein